MSELSIDNSIKDRRAICAIAAICTLPALVIIFLPMLVGGMVTSLGMSESDGGFIASADMAGYTLGTVASFFAITRCNWRLVIFRSLLVMACCNFVSAFVSDFSLLLLIRFLSGLAGGVITAMTFAALAKVNDPDAAFGVWLVFQSAIAIVGMMAFPHINELWGVGGGFFILAVMLVLACALARYVPEGGGVLSTNDFPKEGSLRHCVPGLLAIFVIYSGLMTVWPFVERIGDAGGVSADQVGLSLSLSALAGLVGGMAAAHFGARFGRILPILLSVSGVSVSIVLFGLSSMTVTSYMLAVSLFFGFWGFMLPYLLGSLAALDGSGRALALANGGIGAGLVVGPFLGALLIQDGSYSSLLVSGMVLILIGFLLVLPSTRLESRFNKDNSLA